jgi:hypothetical protein
VADFDVPDSVGQMRGLFENIVAHGDPDLAADSYATQRLVSAGYRLGSQRAEALGRELRPIDVEFGLALLCKWPIKPEVHPDLLAQMDESREAIVALASEGAAIDIDPELLILRLDELHDRLETEGPPLAGT